MVPFPIGNVAAGVAVASNVAAGDYVAAATAAVGLVPGGAVVGRVFRGTKGLQRIGAFQAKLPLLGEKSRLFGDVRSGASRQGILSGRSKSSRFALGWSGKRVIHNGRRSAMKVYRAKIFSRHIDFIYAGHR